MVDPNMIQAKHVQVCFKVTSSVVTTTPNPAYTIIHTLVVWPTSVFYALSSDLTQKGFIKLTLSCLNRLNNTRIGIETCLFQDQFKGTSLILNIDCLCI